MVDALQDVHLAILAAMFDLSRRAAVVTGATGNVGPAVVRGYLEQGAHVAVAVRDPAKGAALRERLGDLAGGADDPRLLAIAADPGDRAAMDRLVDEGLRAWGRLDILANLVGRGAPRGGGAGGPPAASPPWRPDGAPPGGR